MHLTALPRLKSARLLLQLLPPRAPHHHLSLCHRHSSLALSCQQRRPLFRLPGAAAAAAGAAQAGLCRQLDAQQHHLATAYTLAEQPGRRQSQQHNLCSVTIFTNTCRDCRDPRPQAVLRSPPGLRISLLQHHRVPKLGGRQQLVTTKTRGHVLLCCAHRIDSHNFSHTLISRRYSRNCSQPKQQQRWEQQEAGSSPPSFYWTGRRRGRPFGH